ncbi:helix-turn-helix domain-containing protein [Parolsenella catena]|uniref:helix-turn-helix domain-containing protein n=1 Tax=Parolsenella catena TaxID=2003188 RepID=UPI002051110F|nr:MAG TPA: helix-turn-helix domain protein [Caudoviricetes sp.]
MQFNDEFAGNLRAARARADLSQGEVAEKVGINIGTLQKYESGDMTPGADKLPAIAEALGVTPNVLLGWTN